MADDAAPSGTEGQAGDGQQNAAPEAAPDGANGQGKTASSDKWTSGTTAKADSASQDSEPTFFDPKSVPPELLPAYKQMQAAFTKGMQGVSQNRQKIQFFDQLSADPVGNLQKLAAQYGYRMTREQAQAAVENQQQAIPDDWQPQSWQEVLSKAEERAAQKIFGQLQPVFAELKAQKRQTIEKQLSEIDPAWQQYEQEMADLIQQVPGLAQHPEKLYRLAVPQEVIESRATQRAIKRMEEKAKAAAGAGGSTTTRRPSGADPNQRFSSVQEAAAWAAKQLEEQGMHPPRR